MDKWISIVCLSFASAVISVNSAVAQHHHHHHGHHHHHHHHHHGGYWGGYYHHGHYHYHGCGYGYGSAWLTPIVQTPPAGQWGTTSVNSTPATPPQQPGGAAIPAPAFGAYMQVPRVAADLAFYANNLCWTMHRRFQAQPDFAPTYRLGHALLQKAKAIRDLSGNATNREEIARQLPLIDDDMHTVVGGLESWVGNSSGAAAADVAALKEAVAQLGNALHYLMVDVGVPHRDPVPAPAAEVTVPASSAPVPVLPKGSRSAVAPGI